MFRLVVIFVLLGVVTGHPQKHSDSIENSNRIVGGKPAKIKHRPYQAFLRVSTGSSVSLCGGSIISEEYIVTAAHCINKTIAYVEVRIGSADSYKGGQVINATKYESHPNYVRYDQGYDIGLLQFSSKALKLNGKTTRAVKLADTGYDLKDKTKVVVSGWGLTAEGEPGGTRQLREVTVEVISNDRCKSMVSKLKDNMICAGDLNGGKDACQGDSGGPLVLASEPLLVGVVSYGVGCARPKHPGIYTSVAAMRSWIRERSGI